MANTTQRDRNMNNPGGQSGSQGGQGGTHGQSSQGGTGVLESAKEFAGSVAGTVTEGAKGAASAVAEKAGDAASYVGRKAEDATSAMGSGIRSFGSTIRESMPHEGILGSASGAVAGTLESGGRYLEEHGLKGIGEDLSSVIRRNPIPAMLIGIGVGFLVARATSARS